MRIRWLFAILALFCVVILHGRPGAVLRPEQAPPSILSGQTPNDLPKIGSWHNQPRPQWSRQSAQGCSGIQFVDFIEGGVSQSVAMAGDTVYASFSEYFVVFDVSDPTNLERVAYLELPELIENIELYDNYAYVTREGGPIDIVDITDPANPFVAGSATVGPEADEMIVAGGYGYVMEGYTCVRIMGLADPLIPVSLTTIPVVSGAQDIAIRDNYAYLAESGQGLRIFDVTDPASPVELGHYARGDYTKGVTVSGDYAYTVSIFPGSGLCIIDIQDPSNPFEVGFYADENNWDVMVDGRYAYISGNNGDLSVIDVSDPSNPARTGVVNLVDEGLEFVRSDSILYTASWYSGVYSVNVADPTAPKVMDNYPSVGTVGGAIGYGAYLCLWDNSRFRVYDRHFQKTVSKINPAWGSATINDVVLQGSYAYLATSDTWYFQLGGLVIVDLSDPFDAQVAGRYPMNLTGGLYTQVAVCQNRAYAIETYPVSLTRFFDVSDPANPTQIGTYSITHTVSGMDADADYIYLATDAGLRIVQVTDPSSPAEVGSYDFGSETWDVVVRGNYAFAGGEDPGTGMGFWVVDVTDRSNPTEVASHLTNGLVKRVVLSDKHAYLSGPQIVVLNLSDPLNPSEVARCDAWQLYPKVAVIPPFIYTGMPQYGHMLILSVDIASAVSGALPKTCQLYQNYPNPFNPSTIIHYEVARPGEVSLCVFNVAGELVKVLESRYRGIGRYEASWNGDNDHGEQVSSGIYFCRMTASGFEMVRKMVLLK